MPDVATIARLNEAAALVVQPTTKSIERQAASKFLEDVGWDMFGPWLNTLVRVVTAFQSSTHEEQGIVLLCLQLLQTKIRHELPASSHASSASATALGSIREALPHLLLHLSDYTATAHRGTPFKLILQSCCICYTALQVRTTALSTWVPSLLAETTQTSPQTVATAFVLLAETPTELLETTTVAKPSQISQELKLYWEYVYAIMIHYFQKHESTLPPQVAQCLWSWATACHVTPSDIHQLPQLSQNVHNIPIANTPLLPLLIQRLSQSITSCHVNTVVSVAKALTAILREAADSNTPQRRAAVGLMVQVTSPDGFLGAPLQSAAATDDEDTVVHALVTLWTTILTEDIDELMAQPVPTQFLQLGLRLQTHQSIPRSTRALILEAWITLQDVPTEDRHLTWHNPAILPPIVESLLQVVARQDDDEEDELRDFRRLAADVWIGSYHALRHLFLQQVVTNLHPTVSWQQREAALSVLSAVARPVVQRVQSSVATSTFVQDQETTIKILCELAIYLLAPSTAAVTNHHDAVMQCQFWGAYTTVWTYLEENIGTAGHSEYVMPILQQILTFLRHRQAEETLQSAAAQSLQSVLAVGTALLWKSPSTAASLWNIIQEAWAVALSIHDIHVLELVAQGCVRSLVQMPNAPDRPQSLAALVQPLAQEGQKALQVLVVDGIDAMPAQGSETVTRAIQVLPLYLRALLVFIKYGQTEDGTSCLEQALSQYGWTFLDGVALKMHVDDAILDGVLEVEQQLLRNASDLLEPRLSSVMQTNIAVFEQKKNSSTLIFFAAAVEAYGSRESSSLEGLLNHVSNVFFTYISSEKPMYECTELVEAYFDLCQRYILFCPSALVRCEAFSLIAACAAESLTACRGERNSTRASLNFWEKLASWQRLPLPLEAKQALESDSNLLDEVIRVHGQGLLQNCLGMLTGGPRMLWPAAGDVIFAILLASIHWPVPESSVSCVARQWLEKVTLDMVGDSAKGQLEERRRVFHETADQLMMLAQKGPTMKAKAKLVVTDMALALNIPKASKMQ